MATASPDSVSRHRSVSRGFAVLTRGVVTWFSRNRKTADAWAAGWDKMSDEPEAEVLEAEVSVLGNPTTRDAEKVTVVGIYKSFLDHCDPWLRGIGSIPERIAAVSEKEEMEGGRSVSTKELEVIFPGADRFQTLHLIGFPLRTAGFQPAGVLDVPNCVMQGCDQSDKFVDLLSREECFAEVAKHNQEQLESGSDDFEYWCVVVEVGTEIVDESLTTMRLIDSVGMQTVRTARPVRLVRPTVAEVARVQREQTGVPEEVPDTAVEPLPGENGDPQSDDAAPGDLGAAFATMIDGEISKVHTSERDAADFADCWNGACAYLDTPATVRKVRLAAGGV